MVRHRYAIVRLVGAGTALIGALLLATTAGAVDLNDHWLVEGGTPASAFVEITQVGDTVSLPSAAFSDIPPTSGRFKARGTE